MICEMDYDAGILYKYWYIISILAYATLDGACEERVEGGGRGQIEPTSKASAGLKEC